MGGEGIYFQRPPRLSTDPKPRDAGPLIGLVVGLLVLMAGALTLLRLRTIRTWRSLAIVGIALAAGALAWMASGLPDVGMLPGQLYTALTIAGVLAAAAAAIVGLSRHIRSCPRP